MKGGSRIRLAQLDSEARGLDAPTRGGSAVGEVCAVGAGSDCMVEVFSEFRVALVIAGRGRAPPGDPRFAFSPEPRDAWSAPASAGCATMVLGVAVRSCARGGRAL
jgi:hypothetical protein